MKYLKLLSLIPILFLSGCGYAHKVFKNNTGLEFERSVNLCPGAGVRSQKSCKPTSDGWRKAKEVNPATLVAGEKIFQRLENDFLLQMLKGNQRAVIHNYDIWSSQLNNPKSEIGVPTPPPGAELVVSDYIIEPHSHVNMSELYEKDAITAAKTIINAEAKARNLSLDADFVTKVTAELKKQIKDSRNTSLTYHHIVAEYVGLLGVGEANDPQLSAISEMQSTLSRFNDGSEIILGISGIVFSNLNSTQTVVEDRMMSTAIDASLDLVPASQLEQVKDMQLSASSKWSNRVNERINTSLTTVGNGVFFYPLWIKTIVKGS